MKNSKFCKIVLDKNAEMWYNVIAMKKKMYKTVCVECKKEIIGDNLVYNWGFDYITNKGKIVGIKTEVEKKMRCKDCFIKEDVINDWYIKALEQ